MRSLWRTRSAPGAAALALGRRRLWAALAGLHLGTALVAYPALAAYAPPLDWGAWWWHIHLRTAWATLFALPAAAYLLGWDRARAARLRPRAFLGALALCAVLGGAALAAVNVLSGALGAPAWERVRPADNAAALGFPEGGLAIVVREWWVRHPVGRGDLVYFDAADLPSERAAFAGISRVIALQGDVVDFINGLPVVNGLIARHLGTTPLLSWPDPEGRGRRFDHHLVGGQLGEGWPRHRTGSSSTWAPPIAPRSGVARRARAAASYRTGMWWCCATIGPAAASSRTAGPATSAGTSGTTARRWCRWRRCGTGRPSSAPTRTTASTIRGGCVDRARPRVGHHPPHRRAAAALT
ncbi:MAG: hypothetical protein ICV73_16720 [Acetobacteraceae bacterium]|nr:hypothetical protein [Acetobacteraceae bacterium]